MIYMKQFIQLSVLKEILSGDEGFIQRLFSGTLLMSSKEFQPCVKWNWNQTLFILIGNEILYKLVKITMYYPSTVLKIEEAAHKKRYDLAQ